MSQLFGGPIGKRTEQAYDLLALLMKKAHIPLTKCFALSDFGWGSLCSALPGPKARGQRWVYMIKKKKKEISSGKQQATLDNGSGIM